MARQVLPIVGAVVGAYFGNPQLGWAIGSAIGNAVDPQTIKGPSIGDVANQTSQEGGPRPIVFGLSQPIAGNIIASAPHRTVRRTQSQGKGGPKVETESIYRTYAIGVCEGEHTFVRVWKNAQLVYDISDTSQLTNEDNAKFLEVARFYTGTFTQDPSPDLEAIFGVGTTPAHRGTAYMVMADDDLTDMRGAIPQFTFQMGNAAAPTVSDTILELHFDGEDGATTTIDSSQYAHPVSFIGTGGELSDLDPVCGPTSFRAPGTAAVQVPNHTVFNLSDDDWTIQFWIYYDGDAVTDSGIAFQKYNFTTLYPVDISWADNGSITAIGAMGDGEIWAAGTSAYRMDAPENAILPRTWHHIAVERFGSVFTLYVDGEPFADQGNPSASPPLVAGTFTGVVADNVAPVTIAGLSGASTDHIMVDEFYWVKYARFQGQAFTPVMCQSQENMILADVVESICERAALTSDLIDTSELTDEVIGFTVLNTYPAYAALQALSDIYLFDPSNFDGLLHFIKRGAAAVATISDDELIDGGQSEQAKRADPISIPRVLHLNYFDVAGGLATDKQTSERSGDRRSEGETSLQSAVLMQADFAARSVAINHKVMIENSRGELSFGLPDSFIRLVPADVIIIEWEGVNRRVRITQTDIRDGYQDYKALFDRQSAYTSNVEGIPSAPQTSPPSSVVGPTLIAVMDIPILIDADDNLGLIYYVAVSGILPAWTGAQVELSLDGGANYSQSAQSSVAATMGELITVLPDHPQEIPDVTHTVEVRIDTPLGELQATDLTGMLNGLNLAAIGNETDGYELIQFADVDEISEGVWEIEYLLRGRKATATRSHPIGDKFILLDRSTVTAIPASLVDIGRTLTFRATSFGTSTDSGTVVSMEYEGASQTERAPAYLEAYRDGSDIVTTWQGVGRLGSGAQVAHGSRFTGYRVTYDDGSDTITNDSTAQTDTQDVSSLGTPITVSVEQVNSLTGPGPALEAEVI